MNTKTAREIANIIKEQPLSVLIILSILFLPITFIMWEPHFPESWSLRINLVIIVLWVIAFFQLRKEIVIWRRKTILFHYLKKETRHTPGTIINDLMEIDEFTEKTINELIQHYPDVFATVKMKKGRGVKLVDEV